MFENDLIDYPTDPIDEATMLADLDSALRERPTSPRWMEV